MNIKYFLVFLNLITIICCKTILFPSNVKIKLESVTKCSHSDNYSLNVYNVNIQYISSKMVVSGTMDTKVDLVSPIQVPINFKQ